MGLIQIGLNVILIVVYGTAGAAIGIAAAFFLLSIVRLVECSKPFVAGFMYSILLWPINASSIPFEHIYGPGRTAYCIGRDLFTVSLRY